MKSVNGINWKINKVPERLILRNKQIFNISYLLSKVFLDKNYSDQEINNAMNNFNETDLKYKNKDFEYGSIIIEECLKNNGKILIFGDYDVDGYSSTYLLYDYFTNLKINCDYYIPDRIIDGYGPNISLLKRLISRKNIV